MIWSDITSPALFPLLGEDREAGADRSVPSRASSHTSTATPTVHTDFGVRALCQARILRPLSHAHTMRASEAPATAALSGGSANVRAEGTATRLSGEWHKGFP